ncbi:hypothetical protein, variant [Aphanomyces astaci]|uniref:Uncharacterized protein n=1 Tax=Aphanomyces astaci TaxID=112090 RepID=W4FXG1_APHAT|nr:hypothetical protein, variant [Aphanomyces astaci]ETV71353.1 hypothetical protein, variant [Aphanomyces astaci]|eukprot:XP_009839017.1 hypothetical protein, variant [Aphanomyces astaci]
MLRVWQTIAAAVATVAAADDTWTSVLALPNITSIETTLTTGTQRYIEVRHGSDSNLTTIEFSSNLTLDGVVLPKSLQKFALNRVNLSAFPYGFQWPSTLKSMSLSDNKLTECVSDLPESISTLNYGGNRLTSIQACQWPKALETLTVSGNALQRMSLSQTWPDGLKELHMDNTELKYVPSTFPEGLRQLHLNKNKIKSFPKKLPSDLQSLSLSYNKIKVLPAHLNRFPKLGVLELANNHLKSLPSDLVLPKDFHILRLSNNNLTSLPPKCNSWLGQINGSIMLDGNQLSALPKKVTFPPETNVARNQLTVLENLSLPKHFNVNENPLERVSRVTVMDGSVWQTSPAVLKSFVLDEKAFKSLDSLMRSYSFFKLGWTVDAATADPACAAESGVIKQVKDISVCVVPDGS